jgi:hypothetical protein
VYVYYFSFYAYHKPPMARHRLIWVSGDRLTFPPSGCCVGLFCFSFLLFPLSAPSTRLPEDEMIGGGSFSFWAGRDKICAISPFERYDHPSPPPPVINQSRSSTLCVELRDQNGSLHGNDTSNW